MSACVKPESDDPITPTSDPRFSVLGDSYSAFRGSVEPESNDVYSMYDSIGVTSAEMMWWHRFSTQKGWPMERNNSFSGSLISNFSDFGSGPYYAPNSFIRRMDNLGNPDVIFVFGATNDACRDVPLGEYVYSDWTEEQLCTFRPALAYLLDNLQRLYPAARIYFLLDMDLGSGGISEEVKTAYIESMHRITSHYDVSCIDLWFIRKSRWHPNAKGHENIAEQVLQFIETEAL